MTKIIKPRQLGILTKTERRRSGVSFVVSALGLVDLQQPTDFLGDQALWALAAQELPEGTILDMAMPKPCGEVLVAGKAMAPGGVPVPTMTVQFVVGPVAKRLAAIGSRTWTSTAEGVRFTPPKPFTEMPLVAARAFGGPGHPSNPAGLGYRAGSLLGSGLAVPMPNIETPDRLIRSIDDRPPPMLVGALDPASRERLQYAGTMDGEWQRLDFPGLPVDADPRLFLVAPQDQRREGFFDGDEPFLLRGFSAAVPEVTGRLPAMRVRAFVERSSDPAGLYELPLVIDTVWLFGSVAKAVLIYRGAMLIDDIDGKDARTLLLAYERSSDAPRDPGHYAEQIRLRADPDQAVKYMLADQFLRPERSGEQAAEKLERRRAYNLTLSERTRAGQELSFRLLAAKHGLPDTILPAQPENGDPEVLLPTPDEIESGEIDIADFIESALAFRDRQMAMLEEQRSKYAGVMEAAQRMHGDGGAVQALLDSLPGAEGADAREAIDEARRSGAPGSIDDILAAIPRQQDEDAEFRAAAERFATPGFASLFVDVRDNLARADLSSTPTSGQPPAPPERDQITRLRETLGAPPEAGGPDPKAGRDALARITAAEAAVTAAFPRLPQSSASPLDALLDSLTVDPPGASISGDDIRTHADGAIAHAEQSLTEGIAVLRLKSPEAVYPERPLSPHVARRLGDVVLAERARMGSLAGRDLAGADLSGEDLSRTDFTGAFLERANLSRAILAGSSLARAAMTGAVLFGADLSDCDCSEANLSAATLTNASLAGATLNGCVLINTTLDGTDASRSSWDGVRILNSSARGLRLDGARLKKVSFIQTPMPDASLSAASLEECMFIDLDAMNLSARAASIRRSIFLLFKADHADFVEAVLDDSVFLGPASLRESDFTGASLLRTTFQGADLEAGKFDSARGDRATLGDAKLARASLRLASLKEAILGNADLRGIDAFGANLQGCQLRRSDLSGSLLRQANMASSDLSDANLTGADLTGANLDQTHLRIATDAAQ
ncbi:MAG: DUF2169 domain-containing protein [Phreatobacter sp.]|uniref:DUF2169 family type VI secretion system accessory protein n=1 Tax=Phreatobacter sp. TaxID=1966341 RepID=UPI0027371061|nr:DUF2169 domain-containing protein [Phreatobacter sp.]MDP2801264.1 DUF2169 domain-containing protein [Phreatobacter sp.]